MSSARRLCSCGASSDYHACLLVIACAMDHCVKQSAQHIESRLVSRVGMPSGLFRCARERTVLWRTHGQWISDGTCADQPPTVRPWADLRPLIALFFAMSNPGPHPPFLASDFPTPFSRLFRSHSGQLRFNTKVFVAVILPLQSPAGSWEPVWHAGSCRRSPFEGSRKSYDIRCLGGVTSLVPLLGRVLRLESYSSIRPESPCCIRG
jgi:hypothetical protein